MSYSTTGLACITQGTGVNVWILKTVDALATAVGAGYVTDATTASSGAGAPGKGMKFGDLVFIYSGVDSITAMTSVTKITPAYVSTLSTSTGAATLTAVALS